MIAVISFLINFFNMYRVPASVNRAFETKADVKLIDILEKSKSK